MRNSFCDMAVLIYLRFYLNFSTTGTFQFLYKMSASNTKRLLLQKTSLSQHDLVHLTQPTLLLVLTRMHITFNASISSFNTL